MVRDLLTLTAQSRPYMFVLPFWPLFTHSPKRFAFDLWPSWANERHNPGHSGSSQHSSPSRRGLVSGDDNVSAVFFFFFGFPLPIPPNMRSGIP